MATATACGLRGFRHRAGRVLLVACTAVLVSTPSCARGGLGSWPEKSITPPAGSKIVKVTELNGIWTLTFNCSLSFDEVRADLKKKLAVLGWLEFPGSDANEFHCLCIAPDGLSELDLAKQPEMPARPGLTQFEYMFTLYHESSPTPLLEDARPLAPARD